MKSLILGIALGACVIMIRKADELPLWADITITAVGLVGILLVVLWDRVTDDAEEIPWVK